MSVIRIGSFGGEMPSVSPRALPANAAQKAVNLLASIPEFRPLAQDNVVSSSSIADPKTLYRFARTATGDFNDDMSTGWRTYAEVRNIVKGQINDDATERTYATYENGSQPPVAFDVNDSIRRLGVPSPVGLTANAFVGSEFTIKDRNAAVNKLNALIPDAVKSALIPIYVGPHRLPIGEYYRSEAPFVYRGYQLGAPSGAIINAYTGAPEEYNWVLDPSLGGRPFVDDGGTPYHVMPVVAYGRGYALDEGKLATALANLKVPGTDDPASGALDENGNPVQPIPMLTAAQVAELVGGMKSALDPHSPDGVEPLVLGLQWVIDRAMDLLNNQILGSSTAAVEDFYAKKAPEINSLIRAFATNIYDFAVRLVATPTVSGAAAEITAASYLYSNEIGRQATINTIIRAIEDRYTASEGSGGVRKLDTGSLANWVSAGVKQIIDTQAETSTLIAERAAEVDIPAFMATIATHLAYGNLGTASERPSVIDPAGQVAALRAVQIQAQSWADRITAYYDYATSAARIMEAVSAYSDRNELAALLPNAAEPISETRFYIATYVTDWGEESAPSPVSEMLEIGQSYAVTVTVSEAPNDRHIQKWRLYRSNTGSEASAFQFVAEVDIGTLTFRDIRKGAQLGESCPTLTWLEPPSKLRGLVGMPNGILAGFFDNTVCFCEPYAPYAWPVEYQITTESPIVSLGVIGQTLVVGTRGRPYFVSGSDSASMSAIKSESNQSCVSARSMVSVQGGVIYASPDGLCLADQSGVKVLTKDLWTREDWNKLNPSSIVAVEHDGIYTFMYESPQGRGCYALGDGKLVELDIWGSAMFVDLVTDTLYVSKGTDIIAAFRGSSRRTATWRTVVMTFDAHSALTWAKVYSDFSAPVIVRWYGDGELRHTMEFNSLAPQRLPPGRWLEHEIEVESKARVTRVVLAGSIDELKGI